MTTASEPMTRRVIVARPELPLAEAWSLMVRERFRHLPIVSDGLLAGILSDRDILLRSSLEDGAVKVPEVPVGEAATRSPYVCRADTEVCDLVRVMTTQKIDAAPVVDDAGRLVGLVTSTDLLLLLIRLDEAKVPLPFSFEITEHPVAYAA